MLAGVLVVETDGKHAHTYAMLSQATQSRQLGARNMLPCLHSMSGSILNPRCAASMTDVTRPSSLSMGDSRFSSSSPGSAKAVTSSHSQPTLPICTRPTASQKKSEPSSGQLSAHAERAFPLPRKSRFDHRSELGDSLACSPPAFIALLTVLASIFGSVSFVPLESLKRTRMGTRMCTCVCHNFPSKGNTPGCRGLEQDVDIFDRTTARLHDGRYES